jgi:hypothetical protein
MATIDPEYVSKYRTKAASLPSLVASSRTLYNKLRAPLLRYRGGMPAGVLAVISQLESGGNASSTGDADLGEYGYFQITSSFPPSVGIASDKRYDPVTNVFLGCLEYQIEAVRMANYSRAVTLGTLDSWKLARLAFAIGSSGTKKLLAAARPAIAGRAFAAVLDWADRTGGMALGSQSAGLIWYRIHLTELVFQAGMFVAPPFFSAPERIPAPPGLSYTLPSDVRTYFQIAPVAPILALAAAGALMLV